MTLTLNLTPSEYYYILEELYLDGLNKELANKIADLADTDEFLEWMASITPIETLQLFSGKTVTEAAKTISVDKKEEERTCRLIKFLVDQGKLWVDASWKLQVV
jgi:hypothetical protein